MLKTFVAAAIVAQALTTASSVKVTPSVIGEINLTGMKGKLIRQLAWSPDKTELYLMTYEANRDASIKEAFHYLVPATGGELKRVDAQPDWALKYYGWKSAQASPDDPNMKLTPNQERRKDAAVAIPMGGEMARGGVSGETAGGGGGLSSEAAMDAARATQMSDVYTISFKNQIVGEWVNHPIVPGQSFSWAPKGNGLIAYSEPKSGRLVVMDLKGDKNKIDGTRNVVVPAWSDDGTKIAYLEGRGRDKFALVVATVAK